MITLSVIILNYNTKDLTLNCLQSIKEHTSENFKKAMEVIFVDNGSSDGSVEGTKEKYPWVKIIANKSNLGFAKANNRAIKKARGKIILFLNSDTIITENTFEKMVFFLKDNLDAGAVTPRVQLSDGSLDLACHRGFPTPWNAFTYFLKLEQMFPNIKIFSGYHLTWKDFNQVHEVDAISGACFFVKKKVLDEVGDFDERYFMYAEDIDLCLRIKKAGWKIFYNPEFLIIHLKRRSGIKKRAGQDLSHLDGKIRKRTTLHFYKTMKLFYDKHYQRSYPKWMRNMVLAGIRTLTIVKNIKNHFL